MATKKPGLIYDAGGTMRAELLLAAACDHEEQLRKMALFWTGVSVELKAQDVSPMQAALIDLCERASHLADGLDAIGTSLEERLPDDEDEEDE